MPVETRQAGATIQCKGCGNTLEVPKLREIRQLDMLEPDTPVRTKRNWSATEGVLFVSGVLLLVFAAAASYYTFAYRLNYNVEKPDAANIEFAHEMSEIPLVDSWQVWQQFTKKQIDSRPTPYHVLAQGEVARLDGWLKIFGVLAACGLLSMVACLGMRLVR